MGYREYIRVIYKENGKEHGNYNYFEGCGFAHCTH